VSPERQRLVLYGLILLLAGGGVWRYVASAPSPEAVAAAARPAPARSFAAPPGVQLAVLGAVRARPSDAARNPFVFGVRDVAEAPVTRRSEREAPAVFTPPPALVPAGPPPPPPIPLKFIGLVEGTGGRRIAVLSDSKGFVAHGTEGAIIDGRYRILSIWIDTLELAYADGRGRQTLKLSGQ